MESKKGHIGSLVVGGVRYEPVGAVWMYGYGFKKRLREFLGRYGIEAGEEEVKELLNRAYDNMTVKITSQREKYIAVANKFRKKDTHPSYYLHVYQEYTGAPVRAPFGVGTVGGKDRAVSEPVFGKDGFAGGGQIHPEEACIVEVTDKGSEAASADENGCPGSLPDGLS